MSTCASSFLEFPRQFPEKKFFIFESHTGEKYSLKGKEIVSYSERIGSVLQNTIGAQGKVVLALPAGADYLCSLLGCVHANVAAIPVVVSQTSGSRQSSEYINHILDDSKSSCVIVNASTRELADNLNAATVINLQDLALQGIDIKQPREGSEGDVAMLLYSSGSTAEPKGILLSHRSLLAQSKTGAAQWGINWESRIVSWLPHYHNFGLHFGYLAPLLQGASSVVFPVGTFVESPAEWFKKISDYQATHTAAPNFAIQACCTAIKTDSVQNISLRSLQAIVCGGEPVSKETHDRFVQKFRGLGLSDNVLLPHYGLSEVGSVTTSRALEQVQFLSLDRTSLQQGKVCRADRQGESRTVASCGMPSDDLKIKIVHPETEELCALNEVGEIWVKSSGAGLGYFGQGDISKQVFDAVIKNSEDAGFLRTGDLGFIEGDHLYVVGRKKEVMIIHGKNHHPVDVEGTIRKRLPHLDLPLSVFSIDISGEEKVIVVQECEDRMAESEASSICMYIIAAVSEEHRLHVHEINLVSKGTIPKTGSGKIQRNRCKQAYLGGAIAIIHRHCVDGAPKSKEPIVRNADLDIPSILHSLTRDVLQGCLDIDSQRLEGVSTLSELGLDSIGYIRISKRIEAVFGIDFEPALLFKYLRLEELAAYIATRQSGARNAGVLSKKNGGNQTDRARNPGMTDVAIIGISCNFPGGATDPEAFWGNLVEGKDAITPIPEDRHWIHRNSSSAEQAPFPGWGGFIDGVDNFDASFFGVSPLEAESMDPQQRKLLELTWNVFESAGYNPRSLARQDVGFFVGAHSNDYIDILTSNPAYRDLYGAYMDSGLHMSLIANRVSRWFDFHGPSEVINTACSSSLVAVHHAVESILRGDSSMAVAAGINLILSSRVYLASHRAGMLSVDGRCKSFDEKANGFVRAEGYGAVLLKPYEEAVRDKDRIYGVIKAAAVNHNGLSNSLRAPNLAAQKRLVQDAYRKSGLPLETITYIEAHGTGTSLGDPIEIQALKEAFTELNEGLPAGFCGIGTVKTNIGHCESAAGIAGLIKVLLAMKHGALPALLHFDRLNSYISLEKSPFYLVKEHQEWPRLRAEDSQPIPRRAGVSSFGFGGVNAHVVIEEYVPEQEAQARPQVGNGRPALVVLSARDGARLEEQARRLLEAVEEWDLSTVELADLAYTLQVGREAMEERLGLVVGSQEELCAKLRAYLAGEDGIVELYRGQAKHHKEVLGMFAADEDMAKAMVRTVDAWLEKGKFGKLLELWVKGLTFDWNKLYGEIKPRRMSLPTYPFARERYWVPPMKQRIPGSAAVMLRLHALVHRNTSDLQEVRFSSTFTGDEFFLADHVINGQRILPEVAYLEMARAAVLQASGLAEDADVAVTFKNVVWSRPVIVQDKPVEVHIGLYPEAGGEIAYEIYSKAPGADGDAVVHGEGLIVLGAAPELVRLDIAAWRARCTQRHVTAEQCYDTFGQLGITYDAAQCDLGGLDLGQGVAVARIELPDAVRATEEEYGLHPSLLDAVLQASFGLVMGGVGNKPALPFALQELQVLGRCTARMWAVVRLQAGMQAHDKVHKFDIDLCDSDGTVRVRITGLATRILGGEPRQAELGTILLQPAWQAQPVTAAATLKPAEHVVLLCGLPAFPAQRIEAELGARCRQLALPRTDLAQDFRECAEAVFEEIRRIVSARPSAPVMLQVVVPAAGAYQALAGLSGMLKTARLENPKLLGQVVEVEEDEEMPGLIAQLRESLACPAEQRIRYRDGVRWVEGWQEVAGQALRQPWKERGVYLITGGAGGLGLIFAKEIAQQVRGAVLILTGRSALNAQLRKRLQELEILGAQVQYRQVDVTDRQAVTELVHGIAQEHEGLDGILHSAGIVQDSFLLKKTAEQLRAVVAVKSAGLVNLDEASRELELDFLIGFSSIAGAYGNVGQADYAAGNAFMDAYASYRNGLVAQGLRYGQTLSVNWPLWKDGGMLMEAAAEQALRQTLGLGALETAVGIEALYRALASGQDQVVVAQGEVARLRRSLLQAAAPATIEQVPATGQVQEIGQALVTEQTPAMEQALATMAEGIAADVLQDKVVHYFKKLLSSALKLPVARIDAAAPLEQYGIDSVMVTQLTTELEKVFGALSKTLLFEYQTIEALTGYFIASHRAQLIDLLHLERRSFPASAAAPALSAPARASVSSATTMAPAWLNKDERGSRRRKRARFAPLMPAQPAKESSDDIAIIGLAGRYPQAINMKAFWDNLHKGIDCITEVPKERWDHSLYFDADKSKVGKTYSKWGGFIDGVDEFDPLFFNISPREAEMMDPQERLFLQCAYETLEDAGYSRQAFGQHGASGNVGVYVGVTYEDYQLYGAQEQARGRHIALGRPAASIANRVSYVCNFHGPSMTIDTMCSSSLTAIHLACESLRQGGCELAIAGGVNVTIHPNKYLMLAQDKFASSKGRCESFGEGGEGYVPAEGVGAILLKPKAKAIADGDHIYGIIKGTAINHGGKTNGYTVPNPHAQADVVGRAIADAGIDPRTISYLEAHGTGTSLGDPIEITGLHRVFQAHTQDKQFCAIGSVKSNIGHCESASGIAGVTKVLLQLKHSKLVPSLHSKRLNPHIDFTDTPFVVQQELADWTRPVLERDGQVREYPRRAGVSSFGAGGANAHVVIEEYVPEQEAQARPQVGNGRPALVVLSARDGARLEEQARRLLEAVEERDLSTAELADLAYTLQVGRDAMEERLGLVASSQEELCVKLRAYLAGEDGIVELYRGQVKRNKEALGMFAADEDTAQLIGAWIAKGKFGKLLELWTKGLTFDWDKLYGEIKPRRMSLPTYPFARERYWAPQAPATPAGNVEPGTSMRPEGLDPTVRHALADRRVTNTGGDFPGAYLAKTSPQLHVIDIEPDTASDRFVRHMEAIAVSALQLTATSNARRHVMDVVMKKLAETLKVDLEEIDPNEAFQVYGMDSILAFQFVQVINQALTIDLEPTALFECNTTDSLAAHIIARYGNSLAVVDEQNPLQCEEAIRDVQPEQECLPANDDALRRHVMDVVMKKLAETLKVDLEEVDPNEAFQVYGMDSILAFQFVQVINQALTIDLEPTALFECNTTDSLAAHIIAQYRSALHFITRAEPRQATVLLSLDQAAGQANTAPDVPDISTTQGGAAFVSASSALPAAQDYLVGMSEIEDVAAKLLWCHLQAMGFPLGREAGMDQIKSELRLSEKYDRWLEESLRVLTRRNYIRFDGEVCMPSNGPVITVEETWREWEARKPSWMRDANLKAQVALLEATLRSLPKILTGTVPATFVMFPKSSMELVEGVYKNNLISDYFNSVLADAVEAYVRRRIQEDSGARIRIIEIGAGTGGTSALLFKRLKPYQENIAEYCYTDLSKAFLFHAQKEYGADNRYLTYRILDVAKPFAEQGIEPGIYDLAVATNVLHATKNIRVNVRNIKEALHENGLILLNELSVNGLFAHLTFGLLDGWWLYEDPELRIPGCPGLSPESWQAVLEGEQYRSVSFPAHAAHHLGQQIISAENGGATPGRKLDMSVEDAFPLTPLQQAYWIGEQDIYQLRTPACFRCRFVSSEVEVDRLEKALLRVMHAHPMLRIRVLPDGRQRITAMPEEIRLSVNDLRHLSAEEQEKLLSARKEVFQGTLLSDENSRSIFCSVDRTSDGYHMHFWFRLFSFDGKAFEIFFSELSAAYLGRPLFQQSGAHYRDFVQKRLALKESNHYEKSVRYWQSRIDSMPNAPQLPVVSYDLMPKESHLKRWQIVLDSADTARLERQARLCGVTMTVLLCTIFADVLRLWSGNSSFTLNLLFSRRFVDGNAFEHLIGNFGDTLLLEVTDNPGGFRERARTIGSQLFRDIVHSQVSGIEVIQMMRRTGDSQPAMPVVFASRLGSEREYEVTTYRDIGWNMAEESLHTPQIWIDHQAFIEDDKVVLNWDCAEDVFLPGVLDDMFTVYRKHINDVLGATITSDDMLLPRLPEQFLRARIAANDTGKSLPEGVLPDYLERAYKAYADNQAIIAPEKTLNYKDLYCLTTHLAASLRRHGVERNDLVAIIANKGWRQVCAAIAVVQSGGAYLPVASELPPARQMYLVGQKGVKAVLVERELLGQVDMPAGMEVMVLEEALPDDIPNEPAILDISTRPDDLAYVIFTSGSTGNPKGVAIDHRGVINTIQDVILRFGLSPVDRVIGISAFNFDLSVYDIFATLGCGAALVLPPYSATPNPEDWAHCVKNYRVSVWNTVPALLEMQLEYLGERASTELASLRLVMLSGDWIPVSLPDRLTSMVPHASLISLGGATEASIWSNYFVVDKVDPSWKSIPYGWPLSNQVFHVLDRNLQHVPTWVAGDLYIGGLGLAQGYYNAPELTAKSFIIHPETGERLYRTGDLGRYHSSGYIEFLGRSDNQVKIRGFRIELGEIEAALERYQGIGAAAVVVRPVGGNDKQLVAFYVPVAVEQSGVEAEAREYLEKLLPDYMVPSQFVRLDQLPVTENGKINRKALLSMASQLEIQEREKIGPRNETEQKLAQLWMALLHCQEPGIHDNFFTLGGTSLMAVRLLNSIKAAFNREFPLASLLRYGTIAAQAELLALSDACAATDRSREPLVNIRDGKHNLAVLIHPVGGNILCYRELIGRIPENFAVVGLQSPGDGSERTVSALADAYASALAAHLRGDRKVHLFGWSMGGVVGHELARLLESRGSQVASITMVDSWMGSGNRDAARALDGLALLRNFVTDFLNGAPLPPGFEDLEHQDEPGKLGAVIKLLNEAKLLPDNMAEDEFIALFNEHRANYQALVQHRPSPVAAPIRQFRAVRAQSFAMLAPFSIGRMNGERMALSEVISMDEDHFTIMRGAALQRIAECVFVTQAAPVRLPTAPVTVSDNVEETPVRLV